MTILSNQFTDDFVKLGSKVTGINRSHQCKSNRLLLVKLKFTPFLHYLHNKKPSLSVPTGLIKVAAAEITPVFESSKLEVTCRVPQSIHGRSLFIKKIASNLDFRQ